MSATPAEHQALLPSPDAARDPVEVAFVALVLATLQEKDGAVDSRSLGLGLIAVRLDWP